VPEDIENYSPLSSEDGTRSYNLALVPPCLKTALSPHPRCHVQRKRQTPCAAPFCLRSATNCLRWPTMKFYHNRSYRLEVYDTGRHA